MTTGYITDRRPPTYKELYIKYMTPQAYKEPDVKCNHQAKKTDPVMDALNHQAKKTDPVMDALMQRIEVREIAARRKWLASRPKRTNNYDIYSNKKSKCHRGKDWYGR